MSGELRLEGSGIGKLVASLAVLTESASPAEFAVIGGLAVLGRLEGAHRVTNDLDTVATQHGDEPTVVEAVIAAQGVDGLLKGTKVDCIAVGDVPAAELSAEQLPKVEEDRIFVLAHRWALDTADELTLVAQAGGTIVAQVRRLTLGRSTVELWRVSEAAWRRRAAGESSFGEWLFSRDLSHGRRLTTNGLGHWFAELRDEAGLEGVSLHRLRHTVATYLVGRGDLLQAQQRLGHRDASTTLRNYAHAMPLEDQAVADDIDEMLRPRGNLQAAPAPTAIRTNGGPVTGA